MIRFLLLFILAAGGNANLIQDCAYDTCARPFNASTVGTGYFNFSFDQSPGFGPQNIVGTFPDSVTALSFNSNDLTSFDGTNLAKSNIKTL